MLVAGADQELPGVAPHSLVDLCRHRDPFRAGIVGALADKDRCLVGLLPVPPESFHLLVDGPEKGLISRGSFLPQGHGGPRLSSPQPRSELIRWECEMSAQEQHRLATRSEDAYEANQRIARTAESLHFVSRVPMFCECSNPGCRSLVLITLDRYREIRKDPALYLTAPDHRLDGATPASHKPDFWLQRTEAGSPS